MMGKPYECTSRTIAEFVTTMANSNPRSAKVYRSYLHDFDRFNGGNTDALVQQLKIKDADPYKVLNQYVGYLNTKGTLSPKIIGYATKCIKRFLVFSDIDIVDNKFRLKVKLPKAVRRQPVALEKSEIVRILNACSDIRLKTYVLFLAGSGCRSTEALSLRISNFDLEANPPVVRIDGEYTKTKQDRTVMLTEEMKAQLVTWLDFKYRVRTIKSKNGKGEWTKRTTDYRQNPNDFVFMPAPQEREHSKDTYQQLNGSYQTLRKRFIRTTKSLGLKATFHSFRRFAYTTIESLGMIQFADFFLGHANSPYWAKSEKEIVSTFRKCESYLTFQDFEHLEAQGADLQSKVESLQKENYDLRHNLDNMIERKIQEIMDRVDLGKLTTKTGQ